MSVEVISDQLEDIMEELEQERTIGRRATWLRQELLRCPEDTTHSDSSFLSSEEETSSVDNITEYTEERSAFIQRWMTNRHHYSEDHCNTEEMRVSQEDNLSRNGSSLLSDESRSDECSDLSLDSDDDELRKFAELLNVTERAKMSEANTTALLRTSFVNAHMSYKSLVSKLRKVANVPRRYYPMCRDGHMAATGELSGLEVCALESCGKPIDLTRRFWFSLVSDQLKALCGAEESFTEIFEGCKRARQSVSLPQREIFSDYYDGNLFRNLHGEKSSQWNEENEINIFLTFSSDGFELFQGRGTAHQSWPLAFTILNFNVHLRFLASNSLLCAFVPGSHSSLHFDSFLNPIFQDLKSLENGVYTECHDGKRRLLRAFVLFITADFPAASKILGFSGHNAKLFCRHCMKEARHDPACGGIRAIRDGNSEVKNNVLRGASDSHFDTWLQTECPSPRTSGETRDIWGAIELYSSRSICGTHSKQSITLSRGIKRKPIVSLLGLDFVKSFP